MSKVVVTTKQGVSIRGRRVFSVHGVVLVGAERLDDGAAIQGSVTIPRSNVAMVQKL